MDFSRAQRNLLLVEDVSDDEKVHEQNIAETQVPMMFSYEEEDELAKDEREQEVEKDDEVFISTQVQGRIDELEGTENNRKQFKRLLANFTYATEADGIGLQGDEVPETVLSSGKSLEMNTIKRSRRSDTRVKSITKYNTENYALQIKQDRARRLLTMLSGKSHKIKNLLKDIKQKDEHRSDPIDFSTFNCEEWSQIEKLLRERLPKVSRAKVALVKDFVYGKEQQEHPWYSSQLPPGDCPTDLTDSHGIYVGNCEDMVGQKVFTLSQLLDDDDNNEPNGIGLEEEEGLTSSSSNTQPSIPDSVDSGEPIGNMTHDIIADVNTTTLLAVGKQDTASNVDWHFKRGSTPDESPDNLPIHEDTVIDLTQETFRAVSNIASPVKATSRPNSKVLSATRKPSIQVPASNTASINTPASFMSLHRPPLIEAPVCSSIIRMKIYKDTEMNFNDKNAPPLGFQPQTIYEDIVADSEDENYTILELEPCKNEEPVRPATDPCILGVNKSTSTQDSSPTATAQSIKQLRQSLKTIGVKTSRSNAQVLQHYNTVSQQLHSQSDEDKRNELFLRLTHLLQQDKPLLNRIYCFHPITIHDLRTSFESRDHFTNLIDDAVIRHWADYQGICVKNDLNE
ncbi:Slx4p Ecym_4260 [Eremothecium cymbalariae DBVPG|uniref:Structure-specific endonuclease subunit SLX4 n=1 Tax=Eremothecium cymbalariae (strain CBS 270.75 / DBVPG 7215 / KCTC 17166 / NRRL Y-17582) TaxID=931890 RepID=G8JTH1_ERECY|nr:hypothetical protein Ecym_4260 [Eremothecium cymbalariae DBVPG\